MRDENDAGRTRRTKTTRDEDDAWRRRRGAKTQNQKGLRGRNSPVCTLSQNGYGDCLSQRKARDNRTDHFAGDFFDEQGNTHRGARTHDHKVKGLALCRLS